MVDDKTRHAKRPTQSDQSDMLAAALDYHRRGWSIVPMSVLAKRPARKWKAYQTQRASAAQVRAWFANGASYNIGVVFGAISGALVSRDFDDVAAFERWAAEYPDLASKLPTVETRRGRHVYSRAAPGTVEAIRAAIGKPNGTGAIDLGDGELRAGIGCYSVLPPSIHPSGHVYRWLIPLGDELPILHPAAAGFLENEREQGVGNRGLRLQASRGAGSSGQGTLHRGTQDIETAATPETAETADLNSEPEAGSRKPGAGVFANREAETEEETQTQAPPICLVSSVCLCVACGEVEAAVEAAIQRTLPAHAGVRHRRLFDFAREIKGIPALAVAPLTDLRPLVKRWHELALPNIGTKPFDDTWFDFTEALDKVRYPAGKEPLALALARADGADPPAVAAQYERVEIRRLVALCRVLQRTAGDKAFFLASRTAARLLGVHFTTLSNWLRGLCRDGILRVEAAGDFKTKKAHEYRYLQPLEETDR